jgi:hypothetical protein
MPDRRTFLTTCGVAVAAPAFAHFGRPFAGSVSPASPAVAPGPGKLALRVDGWEANIDSASDVWVQFNSSWRANWR